MDAEAMQAIYAPYVERTAITFEVEAPSVEEFRRRIRHTQEKYPWLVAERNGEVLGYAYLGEVKSRAAYAHSAETIAYTETADDYLTDASVRFHERMGYVRCAHFHQCARKFGHWYDMIWMEKLFGRR